MFEKFPLSLLFFQFLKQLSCAWNYRFFWHLQLHIWNLPTSWCCQRNLFHTGMFPRSVYRWLVWAVGVPRFRLWALLHYINSPFSLPHNTPLQPTYMCDCCQKQLQTQIYTVYVYILTFIEFHWNMECFPCWSISLTMKKIFCEFGSCFCRDIQAIWNWSSTGQYLLNFSP